MTVDFLLAVFTKRRGTVGACARVPDEFRKVFKKAPLEVDGCREEVRTRVYIGSGRRRRAVFHFHFYLRTNAIPWHGAQVINVHREQPASVCFPVENAACN